MFRPEQASRRQTPFTFSPKHIAASFLGLRTISRLLLILRHVPCNLPICVSHVSCRATGVPAQAFTIVSRPFRRGRGIARKELAIRKTGFQKKSQVRSDFLIPHALSTLPQDYRYHHLRPVGGTKDCPGQKNTGEAISVIASVFKITRVALPSRR